MAVVAGMKKTNVTTQNRHTSNDKKKRKKEKRLMLTVYHSFKNYLWEKIPTTIDEMVFDSKRLL